MRVLAVLVPFVALAGCASIDRPNPQNLARYCTAENAYLLGSQARAYYGDCPKETEPQFLQGLARGRMVRPSTPEVQPYYQQMAETEKRLLAATSDAERQQLRARLHEIEWWAIHLLNNKDGMA
jgi:hypothetical protein